MYKQFSLSMLIMSSGICYGHRPGQDELLIIDEADGEVLVIDQAHDRAHRQVKRTPIICSEPELESEIDTSVRQKAGGECGMGKGCEAGLTCNSRFICEE